MTYQTIQFALDDGVAKITLNRPDRLNAFIPEMHRELKDALARAAQDARAVLLTGAGRGFCAGQDLSQRRGNDVPDLGATIHDLYNPLIRAMRALEMPIVAAINGVAAGAGMSLALASDIALAARSATFLQAFVKVGLVPDSGSTYFLPRLAGVARARALAMLGEKITAEEAASWGLIWKVVDDDQLLAEALRLARHLAMQPTRALALIKRAFNATLSNDLDAQLDLERDLQRIAGMTDDYREGVAAFFEKRPPRFVGR
jgi:2-(1,2-epoxy-1,2-dihydrophenyl)acetyl-CoA isomerase